MSHLWRRCAASSITAIALAAVIASAPASALAARPSGPGLYVPAATLITADGSAVWSKNPTKSRRIASCTKLLTALVVRDKRNLDDVITISRKAAEVDDGAGGLKAGRKYTVRQLLQVMLVKSANGAAEALATAIGGNEKKFVGMMSAKAKALGLKRTRPADPHGLSPKGYSTAADLAVIARHVMDDPALRQIVAMHTAHIGSETFYTTDRLLYSYRGIEGVKTGYTDPAGYCFVGAARRNGVELIGVVLGAGAPNDRFTQMKRLLDWGFAHTRQQELVSADQTMCLVPVEHGSETTVCVHAAQAIDLTVWGGSEQITQLHLPPTVSAPVSAGQHLGTVSISRDGTVVAEAPLVAGSSVGAVPAVQLFAGSSAGKAKSRETSWWSPVVAVLSSFGRLLGI